MHQVEELNSFKEKCLDVLQNLKNIKKVDKDIIAQMNYNICAFGEQINDFILNNEKSSDQYKDQIDEMIQIYEQTAQYLDDIIYKHKGIQSQIKSDIKNSSVKDENYASNHKLKQDISQFTYFKLLDKLNVLENNNIEFKNYSFNSFSNREMRNICKKTIVSFLNRNGGCIYIGIRDDSTVVGIKLDYSQMDSLKRKIITIKSGISPQMNEKVKVDFVPIKQGQRWYKGHWIVRIIVKQGDLDTLYYYNNQNDHYSLESYFREDGAVIRYKIQDFIQEQLDIALQKNPKSRVLYKQEYAQADQEGLEASIVWQDKDQSSFKRNNQRSIEHSSNKYRESSNQYQIFKNDNVHKNYIENIPKNNFNLNPFDNICINEYDINQINNFNKQEEVKKFQQDAAQRKNQLISKRDNYQNDLLEQNKEKIYQQNDQNKQFNQNINIQNEQEKVNWPFFQKNQESDQQNQLQFNQKVGQNQKQNNEQNKDSYSNQQNQFNYNIQNDKNFQQIQIQPIENPSQNSFQPNNQNQKKKPKKFGAIFYQALCGQQQQN
ncbi:divergent AAA domain protein (macronuclear) [Tetrahymena thermophila SB210]|uniref:Divergent AAA domain protein n=1 Tax=Tetrahymena thermophila (strain SB210) TaxID=312017 RepID=I7MDM0_TETTS|nr:divergent AAA domain protein [Tetrahymena thermophila SB210]EAR89383.3 divergent AAA domain protein [Tetrahymena thermophila SB210]|eukprot:XP_001009628.3 divergent AAA domain protein [Tetrahymena thermophila SB210]